MSAVADQPTMEAPDEPGVADAVGGGPAGSLDGMIAAGDGAGSGAMVGMVGHGREGYAGPTPEELVSRALERATVGTRNAEGLWLACQLRDNGFDGPAMLAAMPEYQGRVPQVGHRYSLREAMATVRSVRRYQESGQRPAREPWCGASACVRGRP